ncbi:MAG: hypothetical protein ABR520_12550 [Mycobacteriales bacterium]|nr:hypothetical protein [Actinomycetota bacterium]
MRRVVFFLVAAAIAIALIPAAPKDLRYVPQLTAGAYLVLALASAVDAASRARD